MVCGCEWNNLPWLPLVSPAQLVCRVMSERKPGILKKSLWASALHWHLIHYTCQFDIWTVNASRFIFRRPPATKAESWTHLWVFYEKILGYFSALMGTRKAKVHDAKHKRLYNFFFIKEAIVIHNSKGIYFYQSRTNSLVSRSEAQWAVLTMKTSNRGN